MSKFLNFHTANDRFPLTLKHILLDKVIICPVPAMTNSCTPCFCPTHHKILLIHYHIENFNYIGLNFTSISE